MTDAAVDARRLERALAARVGGEVRFDAGSRALYATGSSNYRQVPIGVVVPREVDDVVATIETCAELGAPILPRGGGTSLAGQVANVAVVVEFSKYLNGILELDPGSARARVQPGVVLDRLRDAAEPYGLTFGPDPSTHAWCTLGGMIGNNSCGVHSVTAGRTAENVEELTVLTSDGVELRVGRTDDDELQRLAEVRGRTGEIYAGLRALRDRHAAEIRRRYPDIPRRVSGYNLDELLPDRGFHVARALTGTEGTCVTILEATVRLVPRPPQRALVVLGYPDVFEAADHVSAILGFDPLGLEGMDEVLVENMRKKRLHLEAIDGLPEGGGWLLVEFGGETRDEARDAARRMIRELGGSSAPAMALIDDAEAQKKVWEVRESGLGATARVPGEPDTWEGWEDAAVPPARLGPYLREFRALLERYGYRGALYGHFGDGCIHTRINFDLTNDEGIRRFRSFVDDAADLVVSMGGSLSGEHGDGQSRAELLPKMFGDDLVRAFGEFKALWDPEGRMNPGKVVDPDPITSHLRLGPSHRLPEVGTRFGYPNDDGSFARATLRCVGVGKCRKTDSGVMCPSYMVTREEKHSTRGRAHLLFEMLEGTALRDGWRDEHVREALDLCLSCKGCKAECPVNVDVATYKAEFLSHHYRGRLRPRAAYSMGLIPLWARLASMAPGLANGLAHLQPVAGTLKRAAGVAPERDLPRFASRRFTRSLAGRRPRHREGRRVLLWPDTFNEHFTPHVALAALDVLEDAGYRVVLPRRWVCCGRPLYDFGMLDLARRFLRRVLRELGPHIRAGTPVVGLEPSCVAVFRDELPELFADDPLARRLSRQTFTLAELLERDGYEPPPLERRAVVQGHCHHRSVMKLDADRALWSRMRLDADVLDSGCCGMAGAFGFEAGEKYEVSMKVAERVLLPAVRDADAGTLVIADGFSCREQIRQASGRRALHLAEVLAMAREAVPRPQVA